MTNEHDSAKPKSPWDKALRKAQDEAAQDQNRDSAQSEPKAESDAAPAASRKPSPYGHAGEERSSKPRSFENKPRSDRPYADKPRSDKPYGDKARSDRPYSDKPRSDKPYGDKPRSERPYGDKPRSDKPYGDKQRSDKPYGEKSRSPYGAGKTDAAPQLYGEKKAEGPHKNNPHNGRYDMEALVKALPLLDKYLMPNPSGEQTIDFSNPQAVLTLNKALLAHHYGVKQWQIPPGYLCPPIPGRADYLHHANDLLGKGQRPQKNEKIRVLDIGTGANLIYPIIGSQTFGWQFSACDIDGMAITNAHRIVADNPVLKDVDVILQRDADSFFKGVIRANDYFELTLCNPPFFKSQREAEQQAKRKWRNLKGDEESTKRNFGGKQHELWCEGGELAFLNRLAEESVQYAQQVGWFTALVSQQDHIPLLKRTLKALNAKGVTVVPMTQGQKHSRFIAWYFD